MHRGQAKAARAHGPRLGIEAAPVVDHAQGDLPGSGRVIGPQAHPHAPGVDGIEAIRRLRAEGPAVGILVLTSFSGAEQVIPAIQAGADGYLLKDAGPAALEGAIRAVHRGEQMLAPEAAAVVMARVAGEASPPADAQPDHPDLARLTAREREVLAGLGRGLSNRQLAAELFVSEKTVKTHVSSVLAKLRVADRTQAALFAVRVGIADPRR